MELMTLIKADWSSSSSESISLTLYYLKSILSQASNYFQQIIIHSEWYLLKNTIILEG